MDLLQILKNRDLELIRLLSFLNQREGPVKKKTVCQTLNISTKSLRNLIQLIEEEYSDEILCVNQLQELEVTYQNHVSFLSLKQKIIQQSISHQILLTMLLDPKLTMEKLSQQLFLSSSSINRRLAKLRGLLADYHLSLKNLKIIGPEQQIRLFYLHYLETVFSPATQIFPFNQQVAAYAEEVAQLYEREDQEALTTYSKNRLQLLLYISYYRAFFTASFTDSAASLIELPTPDDLPFIRDFIRMKREKFPPKLMQPTEISLLIQFCFSLPLISYEGQLYARFMAYQDQKNTLLHQIYQYTYETLAPLFLTIFDKEAKQNLQAMLFSLTNSGLLFTSKSPSPMMMAETMKDIKTNGAEPLIDFLQDAIFKINEFTIELGLTPFNPLYLWDKYSLLVFQADMLTDTQLKVGLFLGRDYNFSKVSFNFLKNRLKINPNLQFYNLLVEEHPCDFLVTNDAIYAAENRHKYQATLVIDFQNAMADSEKVCIWLYELLIHEHNQRYLAHGFGQVKKALPN